MKPRLQTSRSSRRQRVAGLPHLMMGPPPRRATAGDGAGFAPFGSFDEPQLLLTFPAKSDEQPHPVEPISASPFEATDSGEAAEQSGRRAVRLRAVRLRRCD